VHRLGFDVEREPVEPVTARRGVRQHVADPCPVLHQVGEMRQVPGHDRIPSSCAASRKAAVASGNTNADERAALDDCRYSVRTPREDMSAAAAAGSAHAGSS
jgi:hypothetical protein